MAKTLTVSEEAYERLASKKEPGESFSDVIKKLTGRANLLDLVGSLSNIEAEELRHTIKKRRAEMRSRMNTASRAL